MKIALPLTALLLALTNPPVHDGVMVLPNGNAS